MPQEINGDLALEYGTAVKMYNPGLSPTGYELNSRMGPLPYTPLRYRRDALEYIEYGRLPLPAMVQQGGLGATAATVGALNLLVWPSFTQEYCIIVASTISVPKMVNGTAGAGLDLGAMDQVATHGVELYDDALGNGDYVFKPGVSSSFYVEYGITAGTAANIGTAYVGLRKVGAAQQAITSYTDYVAFQLNGGTVSGATRSNNGTAVVTGTGVSMTNNVQVVLRIVTYASGATALLVNGTYTPTAQPAFTWFAGLSVAPFIEFIQGASFSTFVVNYRKCGWLR